MHYYVNKNCIGCGLCVGTCPEVFFMKDDETAAAKDENVSSECNELADLARRECPVEAIEEVV